MFRRRVVYARDSEGRDTASVATADDGGFRYAEFSQYDRRDRLWERLSVNHSMAYESLFDVLGNAFIPSGTARRVDKQGRLLGLIIYNARGIVAGRVANGYDGMGRRERATTETFGEDRQRRWITTDEYDDRGNRIKALNSHSSSESGQANDQRTRVASSALTKVEQSVTRRIGGET